MQLKHISLVLTLLGIIGLGSTALLGEPKEPAPKPPSANEITAREIEQWLRYKGGPLPVNMTCVHRLRNASKQGARTVDRDEHGEPKVFQATDGTVYSSIVPKQNRVFFYTIADGEMTHVDSVKREAPLLLQYMQQRLKK